MEILKFTGKAILFLVEVIGYVIGTFIVFFMCGSSLAHLVTSNVYTDATVYIIAFSVGYLFIYFFCPQKYKLAVATICASFSIIAFCCEYYWYMRLSDILMLIPLIIGYYIIWRSRKKDALIYRNSKNANLILKIAGGILFMLLVLQIFIVIFKI